MCCDLCGSNGEGEYERLAKYSPILSVALQIHGHETGSNILKVGQEYDQTHCRENSDITCIDLISRLSVCICRIPIDYLGIFYQ